MRISCIYAFDLDGTLLKGNSSFGFYRYAVSHGLFPYSSFPSCLLSWIKLKTHYLDLPAFYARIIASLLSKVSFEDLSLLADEFVQGLNQKDFYAPMMEKLEEALHDPDGQVILFSSSPAFLVGPMAHRLGIHLWYASEYRPSLHAKDAREVCLTGKRKARILSYLKSIGHARSHTFSDHILDLPFLLLGEEKTVVRPKGRLKKIARKSYWNIV